MIVSLEQAVEISSKLRKEGRKIVTTNGAFDILHIGHERYLKEAKKLGDVLMVGVNSDRSPHFKSKSGRPVVPGDERAEMLDSLKPVDYVFLFDDETPNRWVELIKPDFHIKASDASYGIEQCVERFAVEKAGGKVVLIPKTHGKSTTNIIEKVLEAYRTPTEQRKFKAGDMTDNLDDIIDVLNRTKKIHSETIKEIANSIVSCYRHGGKVILFGNGGSFSDALHFAGELEGAYKNRSRPALAALVPANPSALTALANDFGYDFVFRKFVEANAKPGDVVVGLSTSGNSPNVVKGLQEARRMGAKTVAFTGESGGKMKSEVDILLNVPSASTGYIQIAHSASYHIICDIVESELFR